MTTGITRSQAQRFIGILKAELSEDLRYKVHGLRLRGIFNCKIGLNVDPSFCYELKGSISDLASSKDMTINGQTPYVVCERPIEVMRRYRLWGQYIEAVKRRL